MTRIKKFENGNGGWIVFIVDTLSMEVTQVHSTGLVVNGKDDNADNYHFMAELDDATSNNELHSQQHGRGGVRWPEEEGR